MNERVKFIATYLKHDESLSALCEHLGISRKTGYKWVERYQAGGVNALVDRSRAPHAHPHAVSAAVVDAIVAVRRRHPRWGPRKLLVVLRRQQPPARVAGGEYRRGYPAQTRARASPPLQRHLPMALPTFGR